MRFETIRIRGEKSITDTVRYTHWGPVASRGDNKDMAMKWIAHMRATTNDIGYLVKLNQAATVEDYRSSMADYQYPAQNKVFASTHGDISITVAGIMPLRPPQAGSFILDGASTQNDWKGFIPFDHAPFIINPKQGYVSSANQSPVGSTYKYPVLGQRIFEDYRGRVINMVLDTSDELTVEDMKALQQNNYNLHAAEILPILFHAIDTAGCLSNDEHKILDQLKGWNFLHHRDSISPVYYELWYDEFEKLMFDELDIWLPRAHLECDFRQAAQLDDLLEVSVYVGRVGTKSLRLNFEVRRNGTDEMVAEAHFVLVAVRRNTFESVPIPDELKRRLAPYTRPAQAGE
jgi:penicillin amidase